MSRAKSKDDARVPTRARQPKAPKAPKKAEEPLSQVTLKLRESLHRELARKAFNSGMTIRGYVMRALQQAGLGVTEADLVDRRRRPIRR